MKRKEINVFNISFLDLLSGALGAVIILFIAVPKQVAPESSPKNLETICTIENELLKQCQTENELNQKIIDEKKLTEKNLEKKISQLETKIKELSKNKEEKEKSVSKTKNSKETNGEADTGFNFKGKNIAFLIDVSGSMRGDKIGQVKAGLKMLIASMGKEYKVDIIYFPHTQNQDYYSLWSVTQQLHSSNVKEEVYKFLEALSPKGNTPTRSALLYALSNYSDLTDIVLLSDGLPTIGGTQKIDSYTDLVKDIVWHNSRKVQINTIGVGKSFFSNKNDDLYKFLTHLSEKTGGFFYGF